MTEQIQERLGTKAAIIKEPSTDISFIPIASTLLGLEGVFPGIAKKIVDPVKVRKALRREVARSIKGLIRVGTEASLRAALTKVQELRAFILSDREVEITQAGTFPSATLQFEQVWAGQYSTLEVRTGTIGKREVRFTLIGGAENLVLACAEINTAMKSAHNYPKEGFQISLSGNNDLPKGQDIIVTFTPVITASESSLYWKDPRILHTALLDRLGLRFVNNDIQRLASGALRVKEGFPDEASRIGTDRDQGDLNEGKIVRTARGECSGTVRSYVTCVRGDDSSEIVGDDVIAVAGGSVRSYQLQYPDKHPWVKSGIAAKCLRFISYELGGHGQKDGLKFYPREYPPYESEIDLLG